MDNNGITSKENAEEFFLQVSNPPPTNSKGEVSDPRGAKHNGLDRLKGLGDDFGQNRHDPSSTERLMGPRTRSNRCTDEDVPNSVSPATSRDNIKGPSAHHSRARQPLLHSLHGDGPGLQLLANELERVSAKVH